MPVTLPVAVNEVSVPTEVIFGCALTYTVPDTKALATCPETLAPGIFVSPAPDPINLPVVVTLPATSRYNKSSTTFKLEYITFELNVSPTNVLAFTLDVAIPVNNAPLPKM